MRKERVEEQIRDFHAKGIGGFFIHARFGLETEYLSEDWMDCVRHAVAVAEELGMEVWLYDENGFPSGVGDLKVSRVPEYRSKFVDLMEAKAVGGQEIRLDLPTEKVLMAYAYKQGAHPPPRLSPTTEKEVGLLELSRYIEGNRLVWVPPLGEWNIAVYSKCVLEDPNDVVFGVDYLNPDAMRRFFDLTLVPYEKALGEHFGKTVKGIFTDEPTLLPWHHDIDWYGKRKHTRVVVWDDRIEEEMISRIGLDANAFLPHLFFDIDESTPQVRRAFRQAVSDLYMRAFFAPYSQWCEERDLKLTGHVLFEEGLYLNTDFQADIAASLSVFHVPGTDHLGEVTEVSYGGFCNTPKHLTNIQGEKLVASIAHHYGREAAITETYGCAGWGLSFENMKRIADWQYSLGLNMLCPHAVFYSIEGFRKSDAPPSENHMAGWKHYRRFADYIGRLSYALRQGHHVAKIALFYPLREFWGEYAVGKEGEEDRVVSDAFDLCASMLTRLHFDYDILPEQVLASARVENGKLCTRDEEYSVLIAPPYSMEGKAWENATKFLASGGTWLLPPIGKHEVDIAHIECKLQPLLAVLGSGKSRVENERAARAKHVTFETSAGKLIAVLAGTSDPDGVRMGLASALRGTITPDVEIISSEGKELEEIRYVHRESDGTHIFFFTNTSDRDVSAVLSLEAVGAVEEWDPESGEIRPANGQEIVDGRLRMSCEFAPYGSTIYVVDSNRPIEPTRRLEPVREQIIVLPDEWQFRTQEPNALILGRWEFEPRVHRSGEDYTYTAEFDCEYLPDRLLLMLDDIEYRSSLMGGMDLEVRVNERSWRRPEMDWYLDPGFKTLDITEGIKHGRNTIQITIRHSAWSGQPHLLNSPPMLLGDFACDREKSAILAPVRLASCGSWTDFGYPYFSGTGIYTQVFKVSDLPLGARLVVSIDSVRDMVEIAINDASAAVRLWRPWEADVTDLLREGENKLELRVINSTGNFLEGDVRPSGLMGRVRLLAERV
jgi:hypothetical protein